MARLPLFAKVVGPIIIFLLSTIYCWGQDPVYSQFYLNKNYLNPAYAGYTQQLGVGVNSRLQWLQSPGVYSTNSFNANIGCSQNKLGFALTGYENWEGEGFLHTWATSVQTSVNFAGKWSNRAPKMFRNNRLIFSGGLGLGVGQKSLDWSKLTFSDQFSHYGGFSGKPSLVTPQNESSNMIFDMSGGAKLQTGYGTRGGYFSIGAAMFHLNRPVESFFDHENKMSPRYTFHGFWYFRTQKHLRSRNASYMSLGAVVDWQAPIRTSTFMVSKDIGSMMKASLGFRSRTFIDINESMDAFIIQLMLVTGNFTIGYSYDLTVSDLGPQRTFGTHEIGLTYIFKKVNFPWCKGKSSDNCFLFLKDAPDEFQDLYIWNP